MVGHEVFRLEPEIIHGVEISAVLFVEVEKLTSKYRWISAIPRWLRGTFRSKANVIYEFPNSGRLLVSLGPLIDQEKVCMSMLLLS